MGLFTNTIPTAKFNQVGDSVTGTIVRFEQQQRTEFNPNQRGAGRPMFWFNGKPTAGMAADPQTGEANQPVMDQVVVLDTGVDDGNGETERRLFIKGKQMLSGIKDACKAVGARDVDEGGRLTCTWISGAGRVGSPKVYAFQYAAPAPGFPSLINAISTELASGVPAPTANTAPAQRTAADSVLGQPAGVGGRAAEIPF